MGIDTYSTNPASNTSLFPEGMNPGQVNDGMRQVQADIRNFYEAFEFRDYGHIPTYLTPTSFSVPTNLTAVYTVGRRLNPRSTSLVTPFSLFGTITASAFASGVTTVTFTVDSGTVNNTLNSVRLGFNPVNTPISIAGSLAGDRGDITVTGGGLTWAIDNGVITVGKIASTAYASQAEGQAGTENTKIMTALRVKQALTASAASSVGNLVFTMGTVEPTGAIEADGSILLISAYPALATKFGTTYGGDGTTTFGIPDLRGMFIRGASADSSVDPDGPRNAGSTQTDDFQSHNHGIQYNTTKLVAGSGNGGYFMIAQGINNTFIQSAGGNETRPTNTTAMICIIY